MTMSNYRFNRRLAESVMSKSNYELLAEIAKAARTKQGARVFIYHYIGAPRMSWTYHDWRLDGKWWPPE